MAWRQRKKPRKETEIDTLDKKKNRNENFNMNLACASYFQIDICGYVDTFIDC